MNKNRILASVRNVLVVIGILLVLVVGCGVAYVWYIGQQPVNTAAEETPIETVQAPVIKPPQPAANAKVGAAVHMLTSPVAQGANASITVKTTPAAECTIKVVYDKTPSTDSGLIAKVADEYGMVSWSWTVEVSAPTGKWPAKVTCSSGEQSAVVQGDLVVEKAN